MKKLVSNCLVMIICCIVLTGCWDQLRLKDARLVDGLGLDVIENGMVLGTADLRVNKQEGGTSGKPASTSLLMSKTGSTLRQVRSKIDNELSGNYAPSKIRILLLGENLAKKDIYPYLDVFYRDPRNSLGAFVLLSKGTANEVLNLKRVNEVHISEGILDLTRNAELNSVVRNETIQSLCPTLFDEGKDLGLPFIERTKSDKINMVGLALFNGKKFSGTVLKGEDSPMLLLLNDDIQRVARFTLKVNPDEEILLNQFVNIQISSIKRDLKIKIKDQKIDSVDISVKALVQINEYPKNLLSKKSEVEKLNKQISKQLNARAGRVLKKLQSSNCDYFGIGRRIYAFHPEIWNSIEWKKEYPKIKVNTSIKTEIKGTGIIK